MKAALKDIAAEAGVSEMSVSRALRNRPGLAVETRARILAVAERLGYRPDPRVAQLMTHLREARERKTVETVGFIWSDGDRASVRRSLHLRELVQAATKRASELGFRLDEFWLREPGLSGRRLSQILHARGIQSVILSPVVQRAHAHASLDWERLTTVAIGLGLWRPRFHRVHHHHYYSMLVALRELARLGYRRIGFSVHAVLNARMSQAWRAAFLANHPLPLRDAERLLWVQDKAGAAGQKKWLRSAQPEIVLSEMSSPEQLPSPLPAEIAFATLNWSAESPEITGIDQCTSSLAAAAVETVAAQYWRNERGLPVEPRSVLVEGKWRAGSTASGTGKNRWYSAADGHR
jgi:DNA-binding LacI/PurR family transcriptional regulator